MNICLTNLWHILDHTNISTQILLFPTSHLLIQKLRCLDPLPHFSNKGFLCTPTSAKPYVAPHSATPSSTFNNHCWSGYLIQDSEPIKVPILIFSSATLMLSALTVLQYVSSLCNVPAHYIRRG